MKGNFITMARFEKKSVVRKEDDDEANESHPIYSEYKWCMHKETQ